MVAEFEADLIRAHTSEGMAITKAAGKLRGGKPKPKPKLNKAQEGHLVELHRAGSNIAELFGVACATVYQAVHRSDRQ